jgi:putative endonuclease
MNQHYIQLPEEVIMTAIKSRRIAMAGEQRTADYLEEKGYTILERNWRCGRYSEVDLIARGPAGLTVFVEVKARTEREEAGIPVDGFEAVNQRKQRRIIHSARSYLRLMGADAPARFDVAVLTITPLNDDEEILVTEFIYIEGAFYP